MIVRDGAEVIDDDAPEFESLTGSSVTVGEEMNLVLTLSDQTGVASPVVATYNVGGTDVAALYAPAVAVEEDAPVPVDSRVAEIGVVEVEAAVAGSEPSSLDVAALAAQKALDERVAEPVEVVVVHAAPLISELKQRTKDEIPSIFYSSHHWSTVAAERVVTLNGEARREGAQIKPGLRLVEILVNSIVLDYRGTEFRLRALNSWVNL